MTVIKQLSSVKKALHDAFAGKHTMEDMTMTIPTSSGTTEAEEIIDISNYSEDDLERLRLDDPFLYYSIPEMKRQLYDSDSSSPTNSPRKSVASNSSLRRSSCPIFSDAPAGEPQDRQRRESVTRVRRFSTEPHPSVIMQQVMNDMGMDEEFDDSDMEEDDEKMIHALKNGAFDL